MNRYRPAAILLLLLCLLVPAGAESRSYTWSSGALAVSMEIGPAPAHAGGYQDFTLVIETAGSVPEIEFSDFSQGGFALAEWRQEPPRALEESKSFTFQGRLEPLGSGELLISPFRVLSGDAISEEVITEPLPVTVPSLLTSEEAEAAAAGEIPAVRPPAEEPVRRLGLILRTGGILAAVGLIALLVMLLLRRKSTRTEPTPMERALYRTEELNPADYEGFYTRAAEIIREYQETAGHTAVEAGAEAPEQESPLTEILNYYENAAYTGRLGELGRRLIPSEGREYGALTPRSPAEDKAKMMICFSKKEAPCDS